MKHAIICAIAFAALLAAVVSAEIAYGESQTFALGATTSVQHSSVALMPAAGITVAPNPALSHASIRWTLGATRDAASLSIYNVKGELIRSFSLKGNAGQTAWDGRNAKGSILPSGIYLARITAGKLSLNKNLVICR